jgi:hypothetical protein
VTAPKTLFAWFALALVPACGVDDEPDGGDDFRIINGTEVNGKNGAVQMKVPKKPEEIKDPKKAHWYCTGALVAEDCIVTAGHCINNVGVDNHLAGAEWWHPTKTLNGDNGRPIPAEGDVVAKPTKIKVMGTEHRDLAVIKLDKKLPVPVLKLAKETPALTKKIHVLGNGTIEKDEYAHRETDMTLKAIVEAGTDLGYASLELEKIGEKGGIANFGDSGGPALFGDLVVGIGSRLATKDKSVYYASTTHPKAREWLVANLKDVCDLDIEGGTTGGEEGGETGDVSETGGGTTWGGESGGGDTWSEGGSWSGSFTEGGSWSETGLECDDDPYWCDPDDDESSTSTSTGDGDDTWTDSGPTWDLGSGEDDDATSDDGVTPADLGGGVIDIDEPRPVPWPSVD